MKKPGISSPSAKFPTTLFIYGTLLLPDQFPMARYLANSSQYLGRARLRGYLYDLGPYPGAVPDHRAESWIQGSVVRIDDPEVLSCMDVYEGIAPGAAPEELEYRREWHELEGSRGKRLRGWVYSYIQQVSMDSLIPSGDYLAHFKEKRGV